MRKVLFICFIVFSLGANEILIAQQGFRIIKNDNKYPDVHTFYYIFDKLGNPNNSLSISDFAIRDNGENVSNILTNICRDANIDTNISINISFDLGISTLKYPDDNFSNAKKLLKSIFEKRFFSEYAFTSFDNKTYLNREFNDTTKKISEILDALIPQSGSDRKSSFNKEPAGSFKILSKAQYKKVLLLITDENTNLDNSSIIKYAQDNNIAIYIAMFEKTANENYQQICERTGGLLIDKISKKDDLLTIANTFKSHIIGYLPCELSWQLNYNCDNTHQIELTVPSLSLSNHFNLISDNNQKSYLNATPKYLNFSSIPIGTKSRQSFTITALNRDILIDSIIMQRDFNLKQLKKNDVDTSKFDTIDLFAKDMFRIIDGDVKNYLLEKGKFINITIEYTAYQEPIVYTELSIIANSCMTDTILMTAGYPNKKPFQGSIKLVHPNQKEILIVGDTSFVKWKGLLPKDIVQVEYSTDNGKTYKTIKNNTEGLEINWVVPDTPSDSCRVKLYQLWPNNIGQTFYLRHNGQVNSAFFNSTGKEIVTSSGDGNAYVWDVFTAKLKFKLIGHTKKVTWAVFDPTDKYILTSSEDSTVRVWNAANGSLITTLTEHTHRVESVAWSPDAKYFASNDFRGELIIWDTTWNVVKKIKSNNGPVKFASFNPINYQEIATANMGSNIKVWNWFTYKNGDKPIQVYETNAYNNWHVTYNQDGTKIAATTESSKPQRLYVWDTQKPGKYLYYISHNIDETTNNSIISSSFFYHPELKKELILTSSTDNTARLWSAEDGSVFPVIDYIGQNVFGNDREKHNNAVRTAVFDKIGARVVTASWDSTAIIWNLNQREIQQDVSDSLFRIVRVDGKIQDIDFGQLPLGQIKDSLITTVFKNESEFTYKLYNIEVKGTNYTDFTINNQIKLPIIMKPGDSINLEISFEPQDYGYRQAEIVFSIPAKQIKAKLVGNSFQQTLFPNNPIIDFGEVRLGNFKDTTFSAIVRNISTKLVDIDTILVAGAYKNDFSITQGNLIKNINGSSDLLMTVRFNPLMIGRKNAQIQILYKELGSPTIINLFGEGINYRLDSITISTPKIIAKLGEIVSVPIYIQDMSLHSIPQTIEGINTYLTFNSTLLEPIGVFDEDMISGVERTLKISLPISQNGDSILKRIDFKVAFGNDSMSTLKLSNSYPIGEGMLKINENNGSLYISDLCFDNGIRLFDPMGKISLGQNAPNPATNKTLIKFEVLEPGNTKLFIIDLLGNKVADIIDRELAKGSYEIEINTSKFSSGMYKYILQTQTQFLTKSMQIIKD
ncbi:MAG TPA: choice-of-anchor D domain-containing protein [Candidatus Kapabacteria bacterium]|nr:choice-of-anchor D domain-containing protein [Candidatus Kapabacteria bacterium]